MSGHFQLLDNVSYVQNTAIAVKYGKAYFRMPPPFKKTWHQSAKTWPS